MPRASVNGLTLNYSSTGRGAPVLFLHGLFASGRMFAAQINALKSTHRCLTLDWPGHGQSGPAPAQVSLDGLAELAAGFLRQQRLGPCHIVGHSLGGLVALRLALSSPGLVRSLTVVSATADADTAFGRLKARWLPWLMERVSLGLLFDVQAPLLFGWRFVRNPANHTLLAECRRSFVAHGPASIAQFVNAVVERQELLSRLTDLRCPLLAVVGGRDRVMAPAASRRICEVAPRTQLEILPGVGHGVPFEAPELFNQLLTVFLPTRRLRKVA